MELVIKPLSPELADDFLAFFDGPAFSDNPDWAGCYCCFFYIDSSEWLARTPSMNREYAKRAIESGRMRGYIAYLGGEAVGWVNAGPRENYMRHIRQGEPGVCSVVCFTIAHAYRGKGIATRLLQAVIDSAKGKYDYIEAYPLKGEQTCAMHYHGPLDMYLKAGFEIADEFDIPEENEEFYVVRLYL
ncbi:MAG: GNAT family N-acetyltransferase [Burkholderiales bacterium]